MNRTKLILIGIIIFAAFALFYTYKDHFESTATSPTPWSPNPCPGGVCEECPCPPQKPCVPCNIHPGYNKYGPESINDASVVPLACPAGYKTEGTNPADCLLSPNVAFAACTSTPECLGLYVNPNDGGRMKLVNIPPYNSGAPTRNVYYDKA